MDDPVEQELSDRQWRNALAILLVKGEALDHDYVRRSAESLGVADLLDRALQTVKARE
jgi:hypothetical protein